MSCLLSVESAELDVGVESIRERRKAQAGDEDVRQKDKEGM